MGAVAKQIDRTAAEATENKRGEKKKRKPTEKNKNQPSII